MEHLQEAIEKARKQREGVIGRTPAPGTNSPAEPLPSPVYEAPPLTPGLGASTLQEQQAASARAKAGRQPSPAQLEEAYSDTCLIEPRDEDLERNRVIAGEIHDTRVDAYRQLRSQVLSSMNRHNWRTLAITSADENAGKTLTALNLAISMSQEVNQAVMLVDLDLRNPNVHTTLGLEIELGIVDHLLHREPIEHILLNPGYPRLVILPGLPQLHQSSEILTSPQMKAFMQDITHRYSETIIIFDLPPLLRNDDAMVFVPSADACLLVVEDGATRREDIARSLQLLEHAQLLGTVLNKVR